MPREATAAPRSPHWRLVTALALGALGFAAAVATLYATPIAGVSDLGCGVRLLDCGEVLGSRWGKVAGIPLGVAGGFYFTLWMLPLAAWLRSRDDLFLCFATWIMTLGVGVSVVLIGLLIFVIEGTCLFCLITHAANLGAAFLLWPWRIRRPASVVRPLARALPLLAGALLIALGLFQLYQIRVDRAETRAREQTIW